MTTMREILSPAAQWVREGRAFAIATVVAVSGSAPRPVGASMIVSDAAVFGNVSGGCVEGAVYERCLEAIDSGAVSVDSFGYSDGEGLAAGLTCGGAVEVLVRPVSPGSAAAAQLALLAERDAAGIPTRFRLVTSGALRGTGVVEHGTADASGADAAPHADAIVVEVGARPRLIVVGAVEFAVALARLGQAMGQRVSVVDPRKVFANADRFPGAEVVVDWPDRYLAGERLDAATAICVLSHDPRLDVPALRVALGSPADYVGAMGSRRTHDDRLRRLRDAGVGDAELARLRSPIGLDLGGVCADETALSILAEIVADRRGGSGARLSGLAGPVHAAARGGGQAVTVPASPAVCAPISAVGRAPAGRS
ncbi:XdhC family protein [Microbacterium laevaniformans]|nr:hypothetical protein GCM10017578_00840 [Microbacterium laevaniformans]